MSRPSRRRASPAWSCSCLAVALAAQEPAPPVAPPPQPAARPQAGDPLGRQGQGPQGSAREAMWYAPTAADWQKPVLVQWQRTWADAIALAQETKRPILACVNMDGEIASEHYAGIRYRQAETAKLYEPYVCVIASVYRHNPRDFDEQGNRIPCPRFGGVTCGEHIAIEPVIYEKFMDGKRIAPRHIMIELDGSETYDVYLAFDTQSVFDRIRSGIAERKDAPRPIVRGDRSLLERVASKDSSDRAAVEQAFASGDQALRRSLIAAALAQGGDAPVDLLRLAVFGLDPELVQQARKALADAKSEGAVDLINEALRVPMESGEKNRLVDALARLGAVSPRAMAMARVHQGLGSKSTAVDSDGWQRALAAQSTYTPALDVAAVVQRVDDSAKAAKASPADGAAQLALAEATLAQALDGAMAQALATDQRTAKKYRQLMLADAERAAKDAERLGQKGWRLDAVLAVLAFQQGRYPESYARIDGAMGGMPADPQGPGALAALALFAEARQAAIAKAVREKTEWPAQWLTDVHATYSVIARHPLGTDQHVLWHYDFVKFLGGAEKAGQILAEGLARFPESWLLHDRLRQKLVEDRGVSGLEAHYAVLLERSDAPPNIAWFAGYASVVAAEFLRRANKPDEAAAAYERAIGLYDRQIALHPEVRANSDHYAAIALGGQARIAFERSDLPRATELILASFARRREAAAILDGLNLSSVDTAKLVRNKLRETQSAELLAKLEAGLASLDAEQLELPAYERVQNGQPGGQPGSQPGGQRGNRRRGQ